MAYSSIFSSLDICWSFEMVELLDFFLLLGGLSVFWIVVVWDGSLGGDTRSGGVTIVVGLLFFF